MWRFVTLLGISEANGELNIALAGGDNVATFLLI